MPSKMLKSANEYLSGIGLARARAVAAADALSKGFQVLELRGPFQGFLPDIDPNLLPLTALVFPGRNVLARAYPGRGEVLQLPDGFRQLDFVRLPLGYAGAYPGLAAAIATADPVIHVGQIGRFHPTTGDYSVEFITTPISVSAGDGSTDLSGNFYRINATNQWVQIPAAPSMTNARTLRGGRDGRAVSKSMPDSCVAPFGAVARANNTGGGDDKQSGAITEPTLILSNDVDEVMCFPSSSAESLAGNHRYEPLCDHISSNSLDSGGANGFKCKSVETWNGRVYFANTSEAGVRHPLRLRRTAKFTADPNPTIVGAGFYDFREFQGELVRAESLGDLLGIYATDGVAMGRPTGNPTSPDEYQIVSTDRGLLGTHALCPIGRNMHFGIFTDGWWFIDQSGRWQQAGMSNAIAKWRQSFYQDLPANQRHRIYCYYDSPANLIYIARPTNSNPEPAETWIYDPDGDRLVGIENYPVVCFGPLTPITHSAVTIDSLPGTIDSLVGTIDSFGTVVGFPRARAHGDQTGFVYAHARDISGYDPNAATGVTPIVQNPTWLFTMGMRGMREQTTIDRLTIEYFNRANTAVVSVVAAGPTADGSQSEGVLLSGGNFGDLRDRDVWLRYTSVSPGITVSGTGEFQIRAMKLDVWGDMIQPRGQ